MVILLGELGRLIMDHIHGSHDITPTSESTAPITREATLRGDTPTCSAARRTPIPAARHAVGVD